MLDAARSIKLKRNQVWSLQIGDFEANIQFRKIDDLMDYFRKVKWETPQVSDYLKLVLITETDGLFGDE